MKLEEQPSRVAKLVAAVLFLVALLGFTAFMLLKQDSHAGTGLERGVKLPPFAVPLATGNVQCDANIATARNLGKAGSRPACEVHEKGVMNICETAKRSRLVLTFVTVDSDRCKRQLELIEQVRKAFPSVEFAAVAVRGSRKKLKRFVEQQKIGFPVGFDRDGAVANLYRIAVCPTTTFAAQGGKVFRSYVGYLGRVELTLALKRFLHSSTG